MVQQWLLDLGADSSSMPEGYTVEQYEAFWGAGYTSQDRQVLQDLWHTDATETKARAGQMLIDGERVPVAPSDPGLTGLEQLPSGS